jgi:hypothetical protein
MKNKNLIKIIVFLMLLVIFTNFVTSLGVSPARKLYDTSKNIVTGELKIINTQSDEIDLIVYATGENADLILLDEQSLSISKKGSEIINYELNIPEDLSPGRHDIIINVVEELSSRSSTVNTKNSVKAHVYIDVPYPGEFIDAKLNIDSNDLNKPTTFTMSLFSRGTKDIHNINADVIIKGPTNQEITRLTSTKLNLSAQNSGKVTATWIPNENINPGVYFAEVIVNYAGKQTKLTQVFEIGKKSLNIKDIIINNFKLGQINEIKVVVESAWNKDISDARAELDLINDKGLSLNKVETLTKDVPSLGRVLLPGYWNTKNIDIGDYDISVKLFYDDKISEKLFQAIINTDNIQIVDTSKLSGQVIKSSENNLSTISLLMIGIIALIIINVVWLVSFKKLRKQNKK